MMVRKFEIGRYYVIKENIRFTLSKGSFTNMFSVIGHEKRQLKWNHRMVDLKGKTLKVISAKYDGKDLHTNEQISEVEFNTLDEYRYHNKDFRPATKDEILMSEL